MRRLLSLSLLVASCAVFVAVVILVKQQPRLQAKISPAPGPLPTWCPAAQVCRVPKDHVLVKDPEGHTRCEAFSERCPEGMGYKQSTGQLCATRAASGADLFDNCAAGVCWTCATIEAEKCDDEVDNDLDGKVDCMDEDCDEDPHCSVTCTCECQYAGPDGGTVFDAWPDYTAPRRVNCVPEKQQPELTQACLQKNGLVSCVPVNPDR